MIVHGPSMSPFARKVLVFAAEKGIAVEHNANVRPGSPDAAWRAMSPLGKVPALEDGDYALSDSTAIVHYLEAKHPDPALIPAEPKARGRTIWFDEYADSTLVGVVGKMFFNRVAAPMFGMPQDLAAADAAEKTELPAVLAYLESQATADFLVGGALTLADISVATMLVNLHHAGGTLDGYPQVAAFYARMVERPSFAGLVVAERKMLGR